MNCIAYNWRHLRWNPSLPFCDGIDISEGLWFAFLLLVCVAPSKGIASGMGLSTGKPFRLEVRYINLTLGTGTLWRCCTVFSPKSFWETKTSKDRSNSTDVPGLGCPASASPHIIVGTTHEHLLLRNNGTEWGTPCRYLCQEDRLKRLLMLKFYLLPLPLY